MEMEMRAFGNTGLQVSRLGLGLSEIGQILSMEDLDQAGRVINTALDNGVNFLDTAACYGIAEEIIGKTVSHRRDEYVLETKAGHVTGGYGGEAWTAKTIADSIDRSLERMQTDHLDVVVLHSCSVEILERGEVIRALLDARDAGKTRFIGYSGDNENAEWAVTSNDFEVFQTSYNMTDQKVRKGVLQEAESRGMGIVAKRPTANAVWGAAQNPSPYHHIPHYSEEYFRRAQEMQALGPIPGAPEDRIHLSLGFTLARPEIDVAIVGTLNPDHMASNLRLMESGVELDPGVVEELYRRFDRLGADWPQRG
jgi:hypothetical protein